MHLGYRFRLKPTTRQLEQLRQAAGCTRFVWNWFRAQREAVYWGSERRSHVGRMEQDAQLKHLKKHFPWLGEASLSASLQQVLLDLDKSYDAFFEGRSSRPHKKKRDDGDSFRIPIAAERNGQAINLPKIGWVRCIITRPILGKVCNTTITRDGDQWFVSFCTDTAAGAGTKSERAQQEQAADNEAERLAAFAGGAVGIDWGVAKPFTLSTGGVLPFPRISPRERERLAMIQRRIATRKPGSANRDKAVGKLTRFMAYIRNRRLDALHKLTTDLAKNHSLIVIEDLQVDNMTASARGTVDDPGSRVAQKAGLNRAILDIAPGMFRSILAYKCERYGARLVVVPAAYSSQECSCCGHTARANRPDQAAFKCVKCGHADNADVNAAKVILARGIASISPEAGHASVIWTAPADSRRPAPETPLLEAA